MMGEENANELFRQYRTTGDISIRNQIAEKYLYIADILAKKFVGRGVEFDDLKQVASLALLRGIDRFDPDMGMQFTTFITPTITGEIKNYFRDKSRSIKLPRRMSEIGGKVRTFVETYESKYGKKPAVKDISKSLGYSEEEVVQSLEIGGVVSLDSIDSDEEGGMSSLYALLPDNDENYDRFEIAETLKAAMKNLSDTEKALIKYRYTDSLTQDDTAKKLGVSQMFVSRMERKVLLKLKENLKE